MTDQKEPLLDLTGETRALLDPTDAVMLLLDHQTSLFHTVKDISVVALWANTTALAKRATLLKIPVITTASVPDGPNSRLMPEIHHRAPHAVFESFQKTPEVLTQQTK